MPSIKIKNCLIGSLSSSLRGILSCENKLCNDFGFITFQPSRTIGEIIIPRDFSNNVFNISEYVLNSLNVDLVYENEEDIREILKETCEYSGGTLQAEIASKLLLDGRVLWSPEFEKDLKISRDIVSLPSDSRSFRTEI